MSLHILITPNYSAPYDQRMVNGLAAGFRAIGQQAYALTTPVSPLVLAEKCSEYSTDIVIQVNRTRDPTTPLPTNVRHIAWFQDVFPETMYGFAENFRECDILYTLGDPDVLGLNVPLPCPVGSLVSGVDEALLQYKSTAVNRIDFSLCGFIPPPPAILTGSHSTIVSLLRKTPLLGTINLLATVRKLLLTHLRGNRSLPNSQIQALMNVVQANYRPLRGELDIHRLVAAMREEIATLELVKQPSAHSISWLAELLEKSSRLVSAVHETVKGSKSENVEHLSPLEKMISYFARDYPRLLDRVALIETVMEFSTSLELYGPGWSTHPQFRRYALGTLNDQSQLLDVYSRTKINLANNTHGLGLHSRTLECMAAGGFVLTHESPHDNKPGGILTSFEPDVHFGFFTPESLRQQAEQWLMNDSGRMNAGLQAARIVRQRHLWRHRAQQILDDLRG